MHFPISRAGLLAAALALPLHAAAQVPFKPPVPAPAPVLLPKGAVPASATSAAAVSASAAPRG